jgi:hypothetical protein
LAALVDQFLTQERPLELTGLQRPAVAEVVGDPGLFQEAETGGVVLGAGAVDVAVVVVFLVGEVEADAVADVAVDVAVELDAAAAVLEPGAGVVDGVIEITVGEVVEDVADLDKPADVQQEAPSSEAR